MHDTFLLLAESGQNQALPVALTFLCGLVIRKLPARHDTVGPVTRARALPVTVPGPAVARDACHEVR